ncbi:MAG: FMN reductase [Chloroflexi bacterium]|nr:FMN reductase [Chloroflexota bacterium]
MSERRLAVISAGLSQPSSTRLLADRLTAAAVAALGERGISASVTVMEARDHARDLVDHLLTGFPGPRLSAAIDTMTHADGLIAVSPIFNGSYSGLFKTFVDVLEVGALRGTPVLLGATGGSARHSLALDHALRPLFAYLHAAVVSTGVFAATDDWGDPQEASRLARRIDRAGQELAEAMALRPARGGPEPADGLDEVVPFSRLLAGDAD